MYERVAFPPDARVRAETKKVILSTEKPTTKVEAPTTGRCVTKEASAADSSKTSSTTQEGSGYYLVCRVCCRA